MTRTIDTAENVPAEKKRSVWKPLAAAGIGGAVLVATGFGVFAQLSATADTTQTVSTGTLRLALAPLSTSGGVTAPVSNLAPLDTVNRYITLTNNGTIDAAKDLTLTATPVAAADDNLLFNADRGLTATVLACSTGWNVADGTCTGTTTTALATTKLSTLKAAQTVLTPAVVAAGSSTSYKVVLTLQDSVENSLNGAAPVVTGGTGSIQNQSTNIRWSFTEVQRTATTINS